LITLKVNKGATALIVVPRIVEWCHVILGFAKVGVVAMPGTNLLTAKGLHYRINQTDTKVAMATESHSTALEEDIKNCPSLEHLILMGKERNRCLITRLFVMMSR